MTDSLPNSTKPVISAPDGALDKAWHIGRAAMRRNRIPALILWVFGTLLVVGYFQFADVRTVLDSIGEWKTSWGWIFSAISTALFGGLIPAIVIRLVSFRSGQTLNPWPQVIPLTLFWAAKGVEVDFFYRFQGWLFGSESNWTTVVVKTAFDQFVYVPILGLVNVVLFYLWQDSGYSFRKTNSVLGRGWYREKILPVLISNWFVWIPAVALIYCLPLPLQLPVQNLILCFWVLILVAFTGDGGSAESA